MSNPTVKKIMDALEPYVAKPTDKPDAPILVVVTYNELRNLMERHIRRTGSRNDYAKAALAGLLANPSAFECADPATAHTRLAFDIADAMIKAEGEQT